jgi:hypothetical protein
MLSTVTPLRLTAGTQNQLATSPRLLYVCPANTYVKISAATLSNAAGANTTATLHLVPAGGQAGPTTQITPGQSVSAGATYVASELNNHILQPGDSIWGSASNPSAINVHISGTLIS